MEPIGTTFMNSTKMLIGLIAFLTIVGGIASVANLKKVGCHHHQDLRVRREAHRCRPEQERWQFLTHITPNSIVGPFVEDDILQIMFIAVVFGNALKAMGKVGAPVLDGVQRLTGVMFKILGFISLSSSETSPAATPTTRSNAA